MFSTCTMADALKLGSSTGSLSMNRSNHGNSVTAMTTDSNVNLIRVENSPRSQLLRRSKEIRERRANESDEVGSERLRMDGERHRSRRWQETKDEKERRRPMNAQRQRNHRGQRSSVLSLWVCRTSRISTMSRRNRKSSSRSKWERQRFPRRRSKLQSCNGIRIYG